MALSSYWVSRNRKDLAERAIVTRRNREETRARNCNEIASYHQNLASRSSKYQSLEKITCPKTPRGHDESRVREDEKEAKKERLEKRRQKLAHLLSVENDQYMRELAEISDKERNSEYPWSIHKLKEQIEDLQRQQKEMQLNAQKKYMHHMFRPNGSISTEREEEQHIHKEITQAWQHRKEELDKLKLEKQQKEQERIRNLEADRIRAQQEAEEIERLQLQEQEKWYNLVGSKVNQMNTADNDVRKLKKEKEILINHLEKLLALHNKRDSMRNIHRKAFQKIQSLWQAEQKLRRMLNEVKHILDLDIKMLCELSRLNNCASEDTALALLDLSCVVSGKEKLEMQMALENERELEILQLYHEEAIKIWENKRESWMLESTVRDEILNEIFKSLICQVKQKIQIVTQEQRKLLDIKDNCLREMGETHQISKNTAKALSEKYEYYSDKASRYSEELESISGT